MRPAARRWRSAAMPTDRRRWPGTSPTRRPWPKPLASAPAVTRTTSGGAAASAELPLVAGRASLLPAHVRDRLGCVRRFRSWDGTELAYSVVGSGPPLVCIPGGPGQAVEYLGDLGGLCSHRTLILLDNRGTGASQAPRDPMTYRVDRLVADVEALRDHLGLDRMDLFGHSASGGTCLLYAAGHPDQIDHLVLACPS